VNLIAFAPPWVIWALIVALAAAAVEDGLRFRISNLTSAIIACGAVATMIAVGPSFAVWQNVVLMLVILAVGTAAFGAGLFGGGDVKLFAAVGLWLDLRGGLALVSAILLAGGGVAIAYLAARLVRRPAGALRDRRVPYGIAIALGTVAVILLNRGAPFSF